MLIYTLLPNTELDKSINIPLNKDSVVALQNPFYNLALDNIELSLEIVLSWLAIWEGYRLIIGNNSKYSSNYSNSDNNNN